MKLVFTHKNRFSFFKIEKKDELRLVGLVLDNCLRTDYFCSTVFSNSLKNQSTHFYVITDSKEKDFPEKVLIKVENNKIAYCDIKSKRNERVPDFLFESLNSFVRENQFIFGWEENTFLTIEEYYSYINKMNEDIL